MGWATRSRGTYEERVRQAKAEGRVKRPVRRDVPGGITYIRKAPSGLLMALMASTLSVGWNPGGWRPPRT